MYSDNVLILFIKSPRLGQVKKRLQPELSAHEALLLYKAMTEDLVVRLREGSLSDIKVLFWPPEAEKELQDWLGNHFDYVPQQGADMGERMYFSFEHVFAKQYKRAVLVGSDIPTMDVTTIESAFSKLKRYDVVLGPSVDGGYYLIGLNSPHPELFRNVGWGTNMVREQTLRAAKKCSLTVDELKPETDIDTFSDVISLWQHLEKMKKKQAVLQLPKTYHFLQECFSKQK